MKFVNWVFVVICIWWSGFRCFLVLFGLVVGLMGLVGLGELELMDIGEFFFVCCF